jgi:hypothetical protein
MPIPIDALSNQDSEKWTDLHASLIQATLQRFHSNHAPLFSVAEGSTSEEGRLLGELNNLVSESLGLTAVERAIINDLVKVKLQLNDGKLGRYAIEQPHVADIKRYVQQLRTELDAFTEGELQGTHRIQVLMDDASALIAIELVRSRETAETKIYRGGDVESKELAKIRDHLRREHSQWVYFDRNLRIFEGRRTFVLKPLQRFHWTVSQAICDANDLIAETINNWREAN